MRYTIIALAFMTLNLSAQDTSSTKFSLSMDLSPFALGGYSFKGSIKPAFAPKFEFHTEVFSMNYPDLFLALNSANEPSELDVNINYAAGFYTDYQINDVRNSLSLGAGLIYLDETAIGTSTTNDYNLLEYLLRLSYKHYIKDSKFYLNPYMAIGGRFKVGEETLVEGPNAAVDGQYYSLVKYIALGSLFIGYEF